MVVSVGAVHVPHFAGALEHAVGEVAGQGFAAAEGLEPRLRGAGLPAGVEQQTPGAGRGLEHGGAGAVEELEQLAAVEHFRFGGDDELCSGEERQKELEAGDVEGKRGDGDQGVVFAETGGALDGSQEIGKGGVPDGDAFGPAGGAGGVDDVGEGVFCGQGGQRDGACGERFGDAEGSARWCGGRGRAW